MKFGQDRWDIATAILLVAALATAMLTADDYGITWDEPTFVAYGEALVKDLASGGSDERAANMARGQIVSRYGGLFEGVTTLLVSAIGSDEPYVVRHRINALTGLLGVLGTAAVGRWLFGPQGGFYAALMLLLTPVYYGHMFNNCRDIPFAAAYVWSLYFLSRVLRAFSQQGRRLGFGLASQFGVALGFALGVRIAGLLVVAYSLFFVAIGLALAWREEGRLLPKQGLTSAAALTWGFAVAYAIMLVFWPWARGAPLTRPWEALAMMSNFPYRLDVLLAGTRYAPDAIPASYLPHLFAVQTPLPILVLSVMGIGVAGWAVWHFRRRDRAFSLEVALIACAGLAPIGYIILGRSVLYDNFRHVLFTVPIFCIAAAAALDVLGRWLQALHGVRALRALQGVALLAALLIAREMIALHPNQTVYYNALVGGLAGAHTRYETDYWGNSTQEALEILVARLAEACPGQQFAVASATNATAVQQMARRVDNIREARNLRDADFFIGINRSDMLDAYRGTPVNGTIYFDVLRDGVPLSRVRARRPQPCDRSVPSP